MSEKAMSRIYELQQVVDEQARIIAAHTARIDHLQLVLQNKSVDLDSVERQVARIDPALEAES